jgi:hypothetical protein
MKGVLREQAEEKQPLSDLPQNATNFAELMPVNY